MKREMLILSVPFIFLELSAKRKRNFLARHLESLISAVTMISRHLLRLRDPLHLVLGSL